MIETLISSKTRIKLLLKFFLNSRTRSYLRSLEQDFGDSSNGIRVELKRLEEAGMLTSSMEGNRRYFQANLQHPLYDQIHQILLKTYGIQHILDEVILRLENVRFVYLTGDIARGIDTQVIDLYLIGDIDEVFLKKRVTKVRKVIHRKIRTKVAPPGLFKESQLESQAFLLYHRPDYKQRIPEKEVPNSIPNT